MRPTLAALCILAVICGTHPPPALASTTGDKPAAQLPRRAQFGMNLTGISDWSTEWPFVDVFKHSRAWMTPDWQPAGEAAGYAYDGRGNPQLKPGQTVQTLMVRETRGHHPAGRYVITYEGKGAVTVGGDAKVIETSPGRIEADLPPGRDGGILLTLAASDPADPVRNIRAFMPGFERADSPFHPLFVERLAPFGTLRFMDWQSTNNSDLVRWQDRNTADSPRWSNGRGVPVEVMVDLCNRTRSNGWFCMPHLADDEFVRQFAALVKARLDPNLKAYVEYSNEVWNSQFGQARYALEQGKRLGLSDNDFEAQLRFYSRRSVEVFKIWEQVFGAHGTKTRLVRVLASQSSNPWVSEQVLGWGDAKGHVDAVAIAPYFGHALGRPETADAVAGLSVEALLDRLAAEVAGENKDLIVKQAEVARRLGVSLVAYEGGQHMVGVAGAENHPTLTEKLIAANRHPRMYDIYQQHLENWFAAGGGLYAVFSNVSTPGKWGSWGALEYQDQPVEAAHKYRAVVDFIRSPAKETGRPDEKRPSR